MDEKQGSSAPPARSFAESPRFIASAFVQPALRFLRQESAGGVLMLVGALAALAWANSPASSAYFDLLETTIEVSVGDFRLHHLSELTLREWINDGAMVLFFFVVGLEIKREVAVGELHEPRAAALPILAAVGGMVVPAVIYLVVNAQLLPGADARPDAWGIPMATDIAFAVGIVALLGRRVPVSAKLFLLALAIVDDLGAILVIAVVYTEDLALGWLLAAILGLGGIAVMNKLNVRAQVLFSALGIFVWVAMLESGVHATLAGVAVAMLTPVTSFYDPTRFADSARPLVDRIDHYLPDDVPLHRADHHTMERVNEIISDLRRLSNETLPPLSRLQYRLAPLSTFVIVPLFALANGGVTISEETLQGAGRDPVMLGVLFGLLVGKVTGVAGVSWLAVRFGVARLPARTTWRHMIGLATLAGIGFTVALFVAALSLSGAALDSAKIGIFGASLLAGATGYAILRFSGVGDDQPEVPTRITA